MFGSLDAIFPGLIVQIWCSQVPFQASLSSWLMFSITPEALPLSTLHCILPLSHTHTHTHNLPSIDSVVIISYIELHLFNPAEAQSVFHPINF